MASKKMISYNRDMSMRDSLMNKDSTLDKTGKGRRSKFEKKMMFSLTKMLTPENIKKNAIAAIVAAFFTLSGAILMWQLKRIGFYL